MRVNPQVARPGTSLDQSAPVVADAAPEHKSRSIVAELKFTNRFAARMGGRLKVPLSFFGE